MKGPALRLLSWVLASPLLAVRENDSAAILHALLQGRRDAATDRAIFALLTRIGHDLGFGVGSIYRGPQVRLYHVARDVYRFAVLASDPFSRSFATDWPADPVARLNELALLSL